MRIIGIDIGKTIGYAEIINGGLVDIGSFHLKETFPLSLKELSENMYQFFLDKDTGPDTIIGVELVQLRMHQKNINEKSIIKNAMLGGAIINMVWDFSPKLVIPVWPHEHKGREPKEVTIRRVNLEYGISVKNDHEADAISIASCVWKAWQIFQRTGSWEFAETRGERQ